MRWAETLDRPPHFPMNTCRLSGHAYACVTPEGAVFLDLKNDAYLALDAEQAAALSQFVEGWPAQHLPDAASLAENVRDLAEDLSARGLLTADTSGHAATPFVITPATAELVPWHACYERSIGALTVARFLVALLRALVALRFHSFQTVVRQRQRAHRRRVPFDLDRARELVSVYQRLRTWSFSRKRRCMLDSLTLLYFLSLHNVHPDWIIGVRVRAFSAHTWLQYGEWVLNGTPVFVRGYQPILVI